MLRSVLFIFLLPFLFFACERESIKDCGYNGETIFTLKDRPGIVRLISNEYFIELNDGLVTNSDNLLDTIHLLKPCNLESAFQKNDMHIEFSGYVKENPSYSSHNHYTDFYVSDCKETIFLCCPVNE